MRSAPSCRGEVAAAAEREQLSYRGLIAELIMAERDERRATRPIREATFPRPKLLEPEFQFDAKVAINPAVIGQGVLLWPSRQTSRSANRRRNGTARASSSACRLARICGSTPPSRSQGSSTAPTSVITVFARCPFGCSRRPGPSRSGPA